MGHDPHNVQGLAVNQQVVGAGQDAGVRLQGVLIMARHPGNAVGRGQDPGVVEQGAAAKVALVDPEKRNLEGQEALGRRQAVDDLVAGRGLGRGSRRGGCGWKGGHQAGRKGKGGNQ